MKKLLYAILFTLCLSTIADAYMSGSMAGVAGRRRTFPATLSASGTVTRANTRLDLTSTTGFVWLNGVDLSPYVGTDLGSTPYIIVVKDSSQRKAYAYLGAAGSGETLSGIELVSNGDFSVNTGWTFETGWEYDGVNFNAKATAAVSPKSAKRNVSSTTGILYKMISDFVITSGTACNRFTSVDGASRSSTGTYSDYFTKSSAGSSIVLLETITTFTGTVDNVSLQAVTDCPTTALHTFSSKDGTGRGWNIQSGFNYNYSSNYTYEI